VSPYSCNRRRTCASAAAKVQRSTKFTLQSDNLEELVHWSPILKNLMKRMSQLTDVNSDQQNKGLEANVVIDRPTASRLGITPREIDNVLYHSFGERQIAKTYTSLNQYFVVMEVEPSFWQNPDGLRKVDINSTSGGQVPLAAFTHFQSATAALAVNHSGIFPPSASRSTWRPESLWAMP
jgi:multidrug efflux pump